MADTSEIETKAFWVVRPKADQHQVPTDLASPIRWTHNRNAQYRMDGSSRRRDFGGAFYDSSLYVSRASSLLFATRVLDTGEVSHALDRSRQGGGPVGNTCHCDFSLALQFQCR